MTPAEVAEIESASAGASGNFNTNSPKTLSAAGGSLKGNGKFGDH